MAQPRPAPARPAPTNRRQGRRNRPRRRQRPTARPRVGSHLTNYAACSPESHRRVLIGGGGDGGGGGAVRRSAAAPSGTTGHHSEPPAHNSPGHQPTTPNCTDFPLQPPRRRHHPPILNQAITVVWQRMPACGWRGVKSAFAAGGPWRQPRASRGSLLRLPHAARPGACHRHHGSVRCRGGGELVTAQVDVMASAARLRPDATVPGPWAGVVVPRPRSRCRRPLMAPPTRMMMLAVAPQSRSPAAADTAPPSGSSGGAVRAAGAPVLAFVIACAGAEASSDGGGSGTRCRAGAARSIPATASAPTDPRHVDGRVSHTTNSMRGLTHYNSNPANPHLTPISPTSPTLHGLTTRTLTTHSHPAVSTVPISAADPNLGGCCPAPVTESQWPHCHRWRQGVVAARPPPRLRLVAPAATAAPQPVRSR